MRSKRLIRRYEFTKKSTEVTFGVPTSSIDLSTAHPILNLGLKRPELIFKI